ncbi:TrmH family RNA methyltransferase [Candidatus Saccharibacteria bacterium]|nr:TrmH family RNA methyltransferase [Candidatus Saccharibacteria bacterium]
MNSKIYLIAHNIRSCHNVGSLLRTADAMAVDKVYLTGYTPYPRMKDDKRLPHIADKMGRQIKKTALGAEKTVAWEYTEDVLGLLAKLAKEDTVIAALEQSPDAISLPEYTPSDKDTALIVGREVEGIEPEVLKVAKIHLEIPMLGSKESLNVASAAAIALYQLRFKLRRQ